MNDSILASPLAYFITLCTHGRQLTLGQIQDGQMILNSNGRLVEGEWRRTAETSENVELDTFVIMPNHFHAIFWHPSDRSPEILINSFKTAVTNQAQKLHGTTVDSFWQPSYHALVIRHNKAITSWRRYIQNNVKGWPQDPLNPAVGDQNCAIIPTVNSG